MTLFPGLAGGSHRLVIVSSSQDRQKGLIASLSLLLLGPAGGSHRLVTSLLLGPAGGSHRLVMSPPPAPGRPQRGDDSSSRAPERP